MKVLQSFANKNSGGISNSKIQCKFEDQLVVTAVITSNVTESARWSWWLMMEWFNRGIKVYAFAYEAIYQKYYVFVEFYLKKKNKFGIQDPENSTNLYDIWFHLFFPIEQLLNLFQIEKIIFLKTVPFRFDDQNYSWNSYFQKKSYLYFAVQIWSQALVTNQTPLCNYIHRSAKSLKYHSFSKIWSTSTEWLKMSENNSKNFRFRNYSLKCRN